MRKWYNWLCPGINLKRWLFLFVLGVILVAFGLAFVFNFQFMGLMEEYIFYVVYKVTGSYSNFFTYFIGGIFLLNVSRARTDCFTFPRSQRKELKRLRMFSISEIQ